MPRLVVFRGDAIEREITLGGVAIRIGRDKENDLVLNDPDKGVSRVHAEIRPEGKTYTIVDLDSRNGIWVNKQATKQATLTPGVPVTIGPYELMLEDQGSSQIFVAAAPSPVAQPVPTPTAGLTEKTSQASPSPPSRPVRPARPAVNPGARAQQRKWLVGGIAAVAGVAAIVTGAVLMRGKLSAPPPPPAERPEQVVAQLVASATSQIEQGACADALKSSIEPAIALDPGNANLQALKGRAEACVQLPPPTDPLAEAKAKADAVLATARTLIDNKDCKTALEQITTVLSADPENPAALELKKQADACGKRALPPPSGARGTQLAVAVPVPPEQGGLEPKPGELDKDYRNRLAQMKTRFDDAVTLAAKGPGKNAINAFESIERDATDKYLDVHARLEKAKADWRDTAKPFVTDARDLVRKKSWVEARSKFREAIDIDPALEGQLQPDLRGIQDGMLADGQAACKLGKQNANYANSLALAIESFRRARTLLPANDPCVPIAQKFLEDHGAAADPGK